MYIFVYIYKHINICVGRNTAISEVVLNGHLFDSGFINAVLDLLEYESIGMYMSTLQIVTLIYLYLFLLYIYFYRYLYIDIYI
jgi:hypothetical protein